MKGRSIWRHKSLLCVGYLMRMCLFEKGAYFFTPNIQMSEFELKRMIKLNEVTFKVVASADGRYHETCFCYKKNVYQKIPRQIFGQYFSTQEQYGFTVSSLISLFHTCSFHDSIICIVWNIIFVRESTYLYMICGQDSFFVRQLTFSPDNNVATFIYSTGGASKTGQMQEVAEGRIQKKFWFYFFSWWIHRLWQLQS